MDTGIGLLLVLLTALPYVVGFLLPYLIRIVNKDIQDDDERVVMTYLVCFVVTMAIDWKSFESGDLLHVGSWFLLVSQEAQSSFKLYFQPKWQNQNAGAVPVDQQKTISSDNV